MKLFSGLKITLAFLLISGAAYAQGVGASGDLVGTVTDQTGAVVANGTVTATDVGKGTARTVTTASDGRFAILGLAPAIYNVSAAKSGFATEIAKSVNVVIGQTTTLDFHMKVSQVSESIEVTAEPPVIDTEKTAQAEVMTQQYIQDLPINRRDYLTFTLLAPAVSDSTRLASDQDFRVKQTPQSGLSFYGSNGRGNSVTVDGAEANDDAGGVRLTESQDAVQEFQINRSNYGAALGGASGATINIVTKSATNDVHGSLYGFFRNDAFDAANPFSFTQALQPGQTFNPALPDRVGQHVKDSLTREQFGGTIGFPITKDKTFLFASAEALRADAQNAVPILTSTSIFRPEGDAGNNQAAILNALASQTNNSVPCLTGQPNLPSAICAQILTSALTVSPFTGISPFQAISSPFVIGQLENNGGLFPYDTREYLVSARLDHQFNENNQAFLRYSFGHDREENPDVQSLTGFSRGSSVHALDHTILGSWFHQFSARTQNDAHVQFNYAGFNVIPNVPGEVGLDVPGFGNFGTQIFIPNLTIMRRYEIADNVTAVRGKHSMKFGVTELYRGNHTESHTFFPGRFVFGNLPGFILSPCLQVPAACATSVASPLNTANPATINSLQSVSLGLPQFYQQGFGNPTYSYPRPFTAAYFQDTWAVKSNLTLNYGLRYELDSQYGPLHTPVKNFGPRAAFSWDPFKDQKTVVRAGYGIFYSPIYGQIGDVVQTLGLVNGVRQIAQVFVPLTGAPGNPALTSALIYQVLFGPTSSGGLIGCTQPAPGQAACITPAAIGAPPLNIAVTHTGAVPPLSVIFSGQPGYRSPYSQQAELGIEHQIGRGWAVSASGIYVHTIGLPVAIDVNALPTAPFTTRTLANGRSVSYRTWGVANFANPLILQADQYSSLGSALYEGAILEVNKRFSHHFSILANYTFSKAFDTNTDFNSDYGPVDNTNLSGERALSDFDQRHKLVLLTVIDTGKHGKGFGGQIFSDFQLSPIYRYNSGHPFNLLAGTDVNGDRHSTNDRPIGAARNTGLGPDYQGLDMRLTRRIKTSERSELQIMAEGFNLFNRTNYASVNNVVGPNFGLLPGFTTFNVHGSAAIGPSSPLGFTSVLPMRQIQFGARLAF
ncbi:MAG TPA: carboxypeptidase regulatory-like domain-containing protein [Candidatus Angelobacter sp.]|nr:carboxypeptidase regulatory-like domain-containing protein [Candidatus Angelobacter sp.]